MALLPSHDGAGGVANGYEEGAGMRGAGSRASTNYYLCAACGDFLGKRDRCRCREAGERVRVVRDHVVALPAGIMACADCDTTTAPVALRGWTRLYGLVLGVRERRRAAYVCAGCARSEAARSLLLTACLGWWSLPSLAFFAPRATLRNWRAAFTHPADPGAWGAIGAGTFRHRFLGVGADPALDELIWQSPLLHLDRARMLLVRSAAGLYEQLGVCPGASVLELRAAYRARCKALHRDIDGADGATARIGTDGATARLAQLNRAWEVLRDPELRAAYDWLQQQAAADSELLAA